jgi:capsule biosynthesis phosphatase
MPVKRIVIDLDHTLCVAEYSDYANAVPVEPVVEQLRRYKSLGFEIAISTSRNMRTHAGNIGKINAQTLPVILQWLDRHAIPYDEIHVGKPWCGDAGFYVDDRAVRPAEFTSLGYDQILRLLEDRGP